MDTESYLPGKGVDRLVAEKVMGWTRIEEDSADGKRGFKWLKADGYKGLYTPGFSTGIAEAWLVVEELTKKGMGLQLEIQVIEENGQRMDLVKAVFDGKFGGMADTMPLAVCRAALRMV